MHNRFSYRQLLLLWGVLLTFLCGGLLLTACNSDSDASADTVASIEETTSVDTESGSSDVTDSVPELSTESDSESNAGSETETETESETTASLWKPDMGVFNQGKVAYIKNDDGTVTAIPAEGYSLGLDITDKTDVISMCYSVWFDYILGSGDQPVTDWFNVTETLEGKKPWGHPTAFHYWAKPAQGYYRSSDKAAVRNNMTLLYAAGVDFIILDHTNLHNGYLGDADLYKRMIADPMNTLFDTIMEMRAEGKGTPYVVIWCGDNDGQLYRHMYDCYYNVDKWKDCFVYWDEKPLLLTTHTHPDNFPLKNENLFTVRSMWGISVHHETGQWSYAVPDISGHVTFGADGKPEQIGVAPACQTEYMGTGSSSSMVPGNRAVGRKGGKTWYTQWYFAFAIRPKVITLTWWNEWCAQRIPLGADQYVFTDNFNQEYSRDIEPMEGGHGDQYYQWLIQYIAAYKSHADCPILVDAGEEEMAVRMLRNVKASLQKLGYECP